MLFWGVSLWQTTFRNQQDEKNERFQTREVTAVL